MPRAYLIAAFVAGGVAAVGLAYAAYLAEQRYPEEEAPEAAATETGGALDPALLEALAEEPRGEGWLGPDPGEGAPTTGEAPPEEAEGQEGAAADAEADVAPPETAVEAGSDEAAGAAREGAP